ncbi:rhodanese-like domain-containing protein [Nostoc sp. 'Lobaria pulmonaria (5183) cyanobiont']|uniref:rhodanese-like domain-containing protein n=1 Tax=Nostoc sp. 'Lobaria pulmonaria (5183) cyanobiont' TaxID=1618022 RepID=UPI003FA597DA
MNCQQLAQLLSDSAKRRPLVLDARSQPKYAVSHIETAVRIDPLTEDLTTVSTVSPDSRVEFVQVFI